MRLKLIVLFLALLTATPALCLDLRVLPTSIHAQEQAHDHSTDTAHAFGLRLAEEYRADVSSGTVPERLRALSGEELGGIFAAVNTIFFYSQDTDAAAGLERLYEELSRRTLATRAQGEALYKALVITHRLDAAGRLLKAAKLESRLPRIMEEQAGASAGRDRAYAVTAIGDIAALKSFSLDHGSTIVMLTRPTCEYSSRAIQAITSDPELHSAFMKHGLLLNDPALLLDIPQISAWNQAHPELPNYIAYSRSDWPGLEFGETPVFYFYRDGRLLRQVFGWPSPARKSELLEGLAAIGLDK